MIVALIVGIIVGVILALAPGPVAVGAMKLGMDNGQKTGSLFSLGSASMDFAFCCCVIFATAAIVDSVGYFAGSHPFVMLVIQLLIVLAIIFYGFVQIKHKTHDPIKCEEKELNKFEHFVEQMKRKGPFFIGFGIAFANIANPTFLPSLAYVTIYIHKLNFFESSIVNNFLFALGFGIGNFLWLYSLIKTLLHYKNKMSATFISTLYKFAGFTLIGVGSLLGYKILTLTKWNEIFAIILTL